MKAFQYVTATSPASARELVGEKGRYLAGGMDLLSEMKEYIAEPNVLVNVKSLPGLNKIEPGDKAWSIGANVTVAEIEDHPELKRVFPGLQQAAAEVGSRQIRNLGTVGGNLFTGNTCISPVVSNLAIAFGALDATVLVQKADNKQQRMTIAELYLEAWRNPEAHNSLEPGDLILKVEVPTQATRSCYLQMSEKSDFDWALVSCAVAAKVDGNKLSQARVVLGSVSNVPYQVEAANKFLEGKELNETTTGKVADLLLEKVHIQTENGYKVPIIRALVHRALMKLKA